MPELAKKVYLQKLICSIKGRSISDKDEILNNDPNVQKHFRDCEVLFSTKEVNHRYLLKSLIVIGGKKIVLDAAVSNKTSELLTELAQIEEFFLEIGGVIGYQLKVLDLLENSSKRAEGLSFHAPYFIDISKGTKEVKNYIRCGIEKLDLMGEIYVVGGAADRLHLLDEKTKKRLPAAMMRFNTKTLLKRLIEDAQAKEYLHEKITGRKIITPIALMCSNENDNFYHIKSLIKKNNYFERPKDSFFFMVQPSVPVVKKDGSWVVNEPGQLLLKPSGHGALWKLAKDKKLFEWFFERRRKKVLIRQINNPIAGVDFGLLAFTGYGLSNDSDFGFASCPRQVHSAEGMNVLIQKKKKSYFESVVTNIEYCEFEKFDIQDRPMETDSQYSKFSSNTNLLFVDLKAVSEKVDQNPYPGMLINFKQLKTPQEQIVIGGRLETTMQNIADSFVEMTEAPIKPPYKLSKTFVSYNERVKTISTTKKAYNLDKAYLETPEKCFYDFINNAHDLLSNYCFMKVPKVESFEKFISSQPSFLFSYHPALGPIYNVIAQKIKRGTLYDSSELVVDIADFFCENLQLDGCLRIFSKDLSARCFFKNVSVKNAGVDFVNLKSFWKGDHKYLEKCDIHLGKNSTLIAENIVISNTQTIVVPDNQAIEIIINNGKPFLKEVDDYYNFEYQLSDDSKIEVMAEKKVFSQP